MKETECKKLKFETTDDVKFSLPIKGKNKRICMNEYILLRKKFIVSKNSVNGNTVILFPKISGINNLQMLIGYSNTQTKFCKPMQAKLTSFFSSNANKVDGSKKRKAEEANEEEKSTKKSKIEKTSSKENILKKLTIPSFQTVQEFSNYFNELAYYLMNKCALFIKGEACRMAEIEFYIRTKKPDQHQDVFSHGMPIQKTTGQWYFHTNENGVYKSGTYKGLDISCGNEEEFTGGILIRSIETSNKTFIEGPCLCVNYILKQNGANDSIDTFVNEKLKNNLSIFDHEDVLCVKEYDYKPLEIFASPRVGLTLKQANNRALREQFIVKPYRFLLYPKKHKKGKPHIVMALHHKLGKQSSVLKISESTGVQRKTVEKYIKLYEKGKEQNVSKYYGKAITTEIICELCGCLNKYL